jgi:cytochrome c
MKQRCNIAIIAFSMSAITPVFAIDESAAADLLKDSRCTKCHATAMERIGPPFRDIARKYKGKADAETIITKHVTVASDVEVDGEMKEHGLVESKDPAQIKNLVDWILAR